MYWGDPNMNLKAKVRQICGKRRIFMACPHCSKGIVCDAEILGDSAARDQFVECFECKRKYLFAKQISKLLDNKTSLNLNLEEKTKDKSKDDGSDDNTGSGTKEL